MFYLTFATSGKIRETDSHIDPKKILSIHVHTQEQVA